MPVGDQPATSQTQLTDVVWTGSRFVAVGTVSGSDVVFVDSVDGQQWNLQSAVDENARVQHLAVGPNGIVAVGIGGPDARSW
ncbi:MAG: hypothetical protein ACRDGI_04130, partial [Candidatus Limnocylindrales bacterium]